MKSVKIIYVAFAVFLVALSYISGCVRGKRVKKCPTFTTTTIIKHDTITHYIYDVWPAYIQGKDSIIYKEVPAKVDTAFILKDYFAVHKYDRLWRDSLLEVTLKDYISENEPVYNDFSYKILRPQTIINNTQDNSVHYAKYLYAGGSVPVNDIKYADFGLFYAFLKGFVGAGYNPTLKSIQVTGGFKLMKFK